MNTTQATTEISTAKPRNPFAKTTPAYTLFTKIKPGQVENIREVAAERRAAAAKGNASDMIGTVHFFRFVILDGKYLVMASNYDGDAVAYLTDFYNVEIAPGPMQGMWNSVMQYVEDWPTGGGTLEEFLAFWAAHKVEEELNYSYYPGVTAKEVRKALRVQEAFQSALDQPGAAEALKHPALKALLAVASE
jgi:hypothetical protein